MNKKETEMKKISYKLQKKQNRGKKKAYNIQTKNTKKEKKNREKFKKQRRGKGHKNDNSKNFLKKRKEQ